MKKILFAILILFSLILASASFVWMFPHTILTHARVQTLVKKYGGEYFSVPPTNVNLQLTPFGINGKRITISSDHFCLKEPEGCFEKLHIEVTLKWVGLTRIKIVELGPIQIINQSLTIHESGENEKESEEKKSSGSFSDHVVIPLGLKVRSLKIIFPKIELLSKNSLIKGDFKLTGEDLSKVLLIANAKSNDGFTAHAQVETALIEGKKSPFHALLSIQQIWKVDANLDGEIQWDSMNFALQGKAKILHLAPSLPLLELNPIKITRDKNLHLDSSIYFKIEPKLSFAERDSALPKASYSTDVRGTFDVEEAIKENQSHYDYTLKLGPRTEKGVHLVALLKGTYPFPKDEEYRFGLKDLFTEVKIPVFQTLIQNLKLTSSAIPAPFSVLKGSLIFQVGKEGESITQDRLPLLFKADLTSPEQAIQTSSEGMITFKKGIKNILLAGKTELSKITFTLPEFNPIIPQPSLKRDSRIKSLVEIEATTKKKKEKEVKKQTQDETGSSFDLDWSIDSKPGAIRFYYSLFRPFVPVETHVSLKKDGITGTIHVNPLDIHYLNRDAHVDYFNYVLGKKPPRIYEGKLVIKKTEYTIFINVFEKEGKPKVEFTSNPPLEENDIISVLLFNQTTKELSPDESNSVSNTQSAVANRALGLFSIWALSSTPIEAVSYNSASGVYAARVKIGAGLTATIGTDWEKTQEVAFRKRLGKNFVLSTIFGQEGESEGRTTTTLLEWFRRF